MADIWRIELFGGVRATCGDRVVSRFRSGKSGSLLGYLARYPGRMHSRECLAEMFWPGAEAGRGRASLSTAVWGLRQIFGPTPNGSPELLMTSRESVGFANGALASDVSEFTALLANLQTPSGRRPGAMEKAVELYAGEFMAGYYEDWVFPEQSYFASQFRVVLAELIATLERKGAIERAIGYAARAIELGPLREEDHRRLIELHIRAGDSEQARRQYARLQRILARELGTKPSAATGELVAGLRGISSASAESHQVRRDSGPAPRLRPGTFTVLVAGRGDRRGHSAMPKRLRTVLSAHVRRYGGVDAGRTTTLAALFPGVEEALACAGAIRRAAAGESEAGRVSLALDTARVEVEEGGCRGPALRAASRLLRRANSGWTLCSERAAAVASLELDPRISLRDLGMYRLKPSSSPERVFAVHWQGTDAGAGRPLQIAPERQGSAPAPTTPVLGRGRERAGLQKLMLQDEARLVTVLGPAGIGKTTLAKQVAADLMVLGQAPVWYVPLSSLSDARGMPEAILNVIEPNAKPGSDVIGQLVAALGDGVRFLALDCLEHLLPDGAATLQQLLDRRPMLRFLVSSRKTTGLPAERQFALGPLPPPGENGGVEELRECPSVLLFVDRVRAVLPDFDVTEANSDAIRLLCNELEGFPLAIVLAAGRAGVMTPEQLLQRTGRRFDLLIRSGSGDSDRHRSLNSALAANAALLSVDTRAFLARLSVFRSGFTLEAAEEVCDTPDAADHLAELRGCSLLTSEIHGPHLRFHMLDTIREFGEGLLSAAELEACQRRHIGFFRRFAEELGQKTEGAEGIATLKRLDLDQANLRAALERELALDPAGALATAVGCSHYWEIRGLWSHSYQMMRTALKHTPNPTPELLPRALHALGWVAYLLGKRDEAQAFLEQALELGRGIGDEPLVLRITYALGHIALEHGRFDEAWDLYGRVVREAECLGEISLAALSSTGLAQVKARREEYDAARELHEQALRNFRQLGYDRCVAGTLRAMARTERTQERWAEARPLHEEALAIFRQVGDPVSVAWELLALADIDRCCGRSGQARDLAEEALDTFRPVSTPEGVSWLLLQVARIAAETGDDDLARDHFKEAAALSDELGDHKHADIIRSELARLCQALPKP